MNSNTSVRPTAGVMFLASPWPPLISVQLVLGGLEEVQKDTFTAKDDELLC